MLSRTAAGLYWMFRHLERAENTARLVEAGARIALTRWSEDGGEWGSILDTLGAREDYLARYAAIEGPAVWNHLLREASNASSVLSSLRAARSNAREVRTALTREVFEAVNDSWREVSDAVARPVAENRLPALLRLVRQNSALVRGALYGTMLRNEIFHFSRLGTYIERADSTARILDVKYYVLLPSVRLVGTQVDNVQWETILRSVSAHRSYMWLHGGEVTPGGIAQFLIFDARMPRSLAYCYDRIDANLRELERMRGGRPTEARRLAGRLRAERLDPGRADEVIDEGLHEVLTEFKARNNAVGRAVEADFNFNG